MEREQGVIKSKKGIWSSCCHTLWLFTGGKQTKNKKWH